MGVESFDGIRVVHKKALVLYVLDDFEGMIINDASDRVVLIQVFPIKVAQNLYSVLEVRYSSWD